MSNIFIPLLVSTLQGLSSLQGARTDLNMHVLTLKIKGCCKYIMYSYFHIFLAVFLLQFNAGFEIPDKQLHINTGVYIVP